MAGFESRPLGLESRVVFSPGLRRGVIWSAKRELKWGRRQTQVWIFERLRKVGERGNELQQPGTGVREEIREEQESRGGRKTQRPR